MCILPLKRGAEGELAAALQAHLDSRRPVGADVKAIQAQPVAVSVTAAVTRSGDTPMSAITAAVEAALAEYLGQTRLTEGGQLVSINRVIGLLMNCAGVADASGVTINGSAANLKLARGTYACPGTVTLTEAENG